MTEAHLWAAIALLALAGWSGALLFLSRSLLPMANAIGVLNKVDAVVDDRIAKVIERIRSRQAPLKQKEPPQEREQSHAVDPIAAQMANIFGGMPLSPIEEQPDSENLEIVGP